MRRLAVGLAAVTALAPVCTSPPPPCSGDFGPQFSITHQVPLAQGFDCDPPPPCDNCGGGWGDPHLTTFDQLHFDFMGAVEAVAARTPDGSFEMQWRLEPSGQSTTVSIITAIAVKMGSSRLVLHGIDETLRVDGRLVELSDGDNLILPSGATLHRVGDFVMFRSADGTAAVHASIGWTYMDVHVDPPDEFLGQMEGQLGDADGNPDNDIVGPDGELIDHRVFDELYPAFGEAWRVSEDTSLFDYEAGEGPDTYWDPTFPSKQLTVDDFDADDRAAAEAACRDAGVSDPDLLAGCIYDLLVLEDPGVPARVAAYQLARGHELHGGRATPVEGDPAILWDANLGEGLSSGITDRPLPVDGEGHLLVQVVGQPDELVAVNPDDGSIVWRVADVAASCNVAVTEDGFIIAQLAAHSVTAGGPSADVVVIDPSTGELVEGLRFAAPDIQAQSTDLLPCEHEIQYANGRIVLLEEYAHVSGRLWSFTLTEDAIEFDWSRDVAVTWDPFDAPILSPDGSDVFVARGGMQALREPYGINRYDASTGELEASSADLGDDPRAQPVAVGEDLLVSAVGFGNPDSRDVLVRLDGDDLDVTWRLVFAEGLSVSEQAIARFAYQSMAVTSDHVVGFQSDCCVTAVDVATGEPLWAHRNHLGGITARTLVVDAAGTAYLASNGEFAIQAVTAPGEAGRDIAGDSFAATFRAITRLGPATGEVIYALAPSEDGQALHLVAISLT